MKTSSKEVAVLEKEVSPIVNEATAIEIKNDKDMKVATEILSRLNIARDRTIEKMETITKPQKEAIKAAESIFKPFIVKAKSAIDIIRDKMSSYQTEKIEAARKEEAKIAARIGEGKGKLKIETAVEKMKDIEKPAETVIAESGSLKFREDLVYEIEDLSKIPLDYLIPDEVKIRKAMKAGIRLPGVKYSTKMVPINSR